MKKIGASAVILVSMIYAASFQAHADTNLSPIVALQQAQIAKLEKSLADLERKIESGNIACPQFQVIKDGTDGAWHDLSIVVGTSPVVNLNGHHGYHVTADFGVAGQHSLGAWTAMNSHSHAKVIISGDSTSHNSPAGLELRWAGPQDATPGIYNFKLQIRTATRHVENGTGKTAEIRVCIQPLPSKLVINYAPAAQ